MPGLSLQIDHYEPAFEVLVQGQALGLALGQRVSRLVYTESAEEDDELELEIVDEFGALVDDDILAEGNPVEVRFGYLGNMGELRRGILMDPEVLFEDQVKIILRARDLGTQLHGTGSDRVWQRMRHSEIVEAIAAAYGLTAEVTDTGRTVESEPQGGLSDFLFVEKLAKENEFVFFVEEDRLYFGPRRLEESPVLDVEYFTAKAEGIVKGFRPRSNRSSTKGPATTVKGIGFDPFEREPKVHEAAENTTEEPRLSGRYFDAETGEFRLMETEPTPHQTEEEVRKSAETTRREAELGQFEAQLSLIGSPMVRANRQIRIRGVGRRYSGNWRITRAKHTIGEGGYTTDLTLSRDGIGDQQPGTAESARPVNDSEAVPQGGERMLIFDAETGETVGASD